MYAVRQYDPIEALVRARELDAALHRAMRERGEPLIDPRHLDAARPSARPSDPAGGR